MSDKQSKSVRCWIARIWSIASLSLLCAFIVGNAQQASQWPTVSEWMGLLLFPIGVSLGLIVVWWNESWGGWITVLSLVGFYAWNVLVDGQIPKGPWFIIIGAPGLLFAMIALSQKKIQNLE